MALPFDAAGSRNGRASNSDDDQPADDQQFHPLITDRPRQEGKDKELPLSSLKAHICGGVPAQRRRYLHAADYPGAQLAGYDPKLFATGEGRC